MDLEDLVSGVEDVTDSQCMDKILIRLDELQTEDEDFMEQLIERLKNETITWSQPWYQKPSSLTRPLDTRGENGSKTFHTDTFNKEESNIIAENWKKLRKMYGLPNKPQCFARWRNRNKSRNPNTNVERVRQFVTAYLARGLERNLYQVYNFFVSHYAAKKKGPYTATEEKIMAICFYHEPTKAVPMLSAILSREPRGISKKLKLISNGKIHHKSQSAENLDQINESIETINEGKPDKKRVRWKLPLATKFVQSLMKHSEKSFAELKDAKFSIPVWLKVQEDMEQDYRYLQKFWYTFLHVQLFAKCNVKLQQLRKDVLKRLKSSYSIWTDIRWKQLLKNYPDGFTHGFLYRLVHHLVIKYPGNYRKDPLPNVIKYALKRLKSIKAKYGEKRLLTLKIDNIGNLEIVKYNEQMMSVKKNDISNDEKIMSVQNNDINDDEEMMSVKKNDISNDEEIMFVQNNDINDDEELMSVKKNDISNDEKMMSVQNNDINDDEEMISVQNDTNNDEEISVQNNDINDDDK